MPNDAPSFGSLFAGVGGFDYGLERAGFRCAWQVEIDDAASRVLAVRWPGVERWSDVRAVVQDESDGRSGADSQPWRHRLLGSRSCSGRVDLLVGGFPCQDLSVAGKRAGLGGERSGLFWEIVRIAKVLKPTWGLFENVPGLLSSHHGRDFWAVLSGLRECWPVVGYRVLNSQFFGVAQQRRRLFLVCGPDEAGVAQVLFESEGSGRDLAPGREAGAQFASSLTAGAHGAGVSAPGRRKEDDVNLVVAHALLVPTSNARYDPNGETYIVAKPIKAGGNDRHDESHENYVVATLKSGGNAGGFCTEPGEHLVTHARTGDGCDASEDGTGRGTPLVLAQNGSDVQVGDKPGAVTAGQARQTSGDLIAHPLTLSANQTPAVSVGITVRRLTPTECERLQAFPDGWTCRCLPLDEWARDPENAAARCTCPDTPRYKQMGNAVTVSVVFWIGTRLRGVMGY